MPIVQFPGGLLSLNAQNKLGRPIQYGRGIFGVSLYGVGNLRNGIYQRRRCRNGYRTIKMRFYQPQNPQTEPQQTNRSRFADAVAAWQDLTSEEKQVYNKRAVGTPRTGNNIFISEFMSS